jgi:hypothetical protein
MHKFPWLVKAPRFNHYLIMGIFLPPRSFSPRPVILGLWYGKVTLSVIHGASISLGTAPTKQIAGSSLRKIYPTYFGDGALHCAAPCTGCPKALY